MTDRLKVQPVYVVDLKRPWRSIKRGDCPIIRGKKMTWAQGPRHRHMLGGSAFFLRSQAERRKVHLLNRIEMSPAMHFVAPGVWALAHEALRHIRRTGEIT